MATKEESCAVITIKRPGLMTAKGRRDIAAWLRRHADMLVKEGKNYTEGRFTGRYLVAK